MSAASKIVAAPALARAQGEGIRRRRAGGASVLPGSHVVEIQRARLLAGALRAIDEFGYARATVADITDRSHVSRRTFYELFSNYEECVLELLDSVVGHVRYQLAAAELDGLSWRERVRGGLWAILCLFEREPALARVIVVQSAQGGLEIVERRERLLSELAAAIDDGRCEGARGTDCPQLTAEGLVGAAVSILHTRLLRGRDEPLTDLHGELMAMIVLPYLGPAAARSERTRPAPARVSVGAGHDHERSGPGVQSGGVRGDPLADIRIRITHRTVRMLEAIAWSPGLSNRQAGDAAGIADQGQVSKLLARLEHRGLLVNTGKERPRGEPNAWELTPTGHRVAQIVGINTHHDKHGKTGVA